MTLLKILYYYFIEYDLEPAMHKIQGELIKLNARILNGDKQAEKLAWERLNELDSLKIEFENRNFKY